MAAPPLNVALPALDDTMGAWLIGTIVGVLYVGFPQFIVTPVDRFPAVYKV